MASRRLFDGAQAELGLLPIVGAAVASGVTGDLSATLANATLAADGTLTAFTGDLSATLADATLIAFGGPPSVTPVRGAAGDNPRRKRGRTWTLAEWQEEQRRRREQLAGLPHDVEIPQAPQPIPTPRGLQMPSGALAGLIPPRALPASLIPRAVPVEWRDDEEDDLELLLLA